MALRTVLIALCAAGMWSVSARAQRLTAGSGADVALTASFQRIQNASANTFWLKGGGIDAAYTFFHGFGVAGNMTAVHGSGVGSGVNLGKATLTLGPRYTVALGRQHSVRIFAQTLFGGVHAFDTVLPQGNSVVFSGNASAMQFGGGIDVTVHRSVAIRPVQVDYVRTTLPNGGDNQQRELRLAAGLVWHR